MYDLLGFGLVACLGGAIVGWSISRWIDNPGKDDDDEIVEFDPYTL